MLRTAIFAVTTVGLLAIWRPALASDMPRTDAGRLSVSPEVPVDNGTPDRAFPDKPPRSATQRETDLVDRMATRIRREQGAAYPGEGALGTGTSITH